MSFKSVSGQGVMGQVRIGERSPTVKALAVGDSSEWTQDGNLTLRESVAFIAFEDIDEEALEELEPAIILSPVLAKSFDCIELALLLAKLGFTGEYRALARDLPKPEVIEREVRQLCPTLKFRIVGNL